MMRRVFIAGFECCDDDFIRLMRIKDNLLVADKLGQSVKLILQVLFKFDCLQLVCRLEYSAFLQIVYQTMKSSSTCPSFVGNIYAC